MDQKKDEKKEEKYSLTSKVKTAIFLIIMLGAVAVAAMSVLEKSRVESGVEKIGGQETNSAIANPCGTSLDSLSGKSVSRKPGPCCPR